jgi:transposase
MELTQEQFARISGCLPVQRGNVTIENFTIVNAFLHIASQGCSWRGLPEKFGNWHTIYTRLSRWCKSGVLARVFEKLQEERIVDVRITAMSLDSTSVKVHPNAAGAPKKMGGNPSASPAAGGTPRFIWSPRMTAPR